MTDFSSVGCLVYKILNGIEVRITPSTEDKYRSGRHFEPGDLVSIDFVLQDKGSQNGPYLRLSDGSGWIFEKKLYGRNATWTIYAQEVPVEKGLWCFYMGNEPVGISLRNHPMDQLRGKKQQGIVLKQVPETLSTIHPMHKLYCDRKVRGKDGVNFYRIQGPGISSWLFDRRIVDPEDVDNPDIILYPESLVQSGLFAFRALANLEIRLLPRVADESRSGWTVKVGDVVVCDVMRESPHQTKFGNGPFLHLQDGTGWLFANIQNKQIMEQVQIEEGKWILQVTNSAGIALRKQPNDSTKSRFPKIYSQNEIVACDRRILPPNSSSEDGDKELTNPTFYRVEGTEGWLFDKRCDHQMMQLLSTHDQSLEQSQQQQNGVERGWTADFVRGIAVTAVRGMKEIALNSQSRSISFEHPNGARINVYYTTKTIGTTLDNSNPHHSLRGNTQLFHRHCTQDELIEILQNPRVQEGQQRQQPHQTGTNEEGDNDADAAVSTSNSNGGTSSNGGTTIDVDMEEEFRNRLRKLDDQMSDLMMKRKVLQQSIGAHESRRLNDDNRMWQKQSDHIKELVKEEEERIMQEQNELKQPEHQHLKR